MAALTQNQPLTNQYGGIGDSVLPNRFYLPVAANVHIFQGAMVVVDAAGNANPAGSATGAYVPGMVVGRSNSEQNNTGGAAGALAVEVQEGAFFWFFTAPLTQANFGSKVYAVDDQTVILSNAGPNVTAAGLFIGLDTSPDSQTYGMAGVLTILGAFGATT